MAKNTSITLGYHFDRFISSQVDSGRFGSASEVIRAALQLLENSEAQLETQRKMLKEGEQSGITDYNFNTLMDELDNEHDKKDF